MPLSQIILLTAVRLHERYRLRAYDSVQLASALELQRRLRAKGHTLIFLSADARLLHAAAQDGMTTDDPNRYP